MLRQNMIAFPYLFSVAKDSSNPVFLKLVLQGLAADWKVENDLLMANLKSSHAPDQFEPFTSNTTLNPEDDAGACGSESQVPFVRTPSPMSSPDLCYASADFLSNVGEFYAIFLPRSSLEIIISLKTCDHVD